jgi:hypothetical protein
MSFDDHNRDDFGNLRSSTHNQFDGHRAGVLPNDSADVAWHKVEQQKARDRMWYPDDNSPKPDYGSEPSINYGGAGDSSWFFVAIIAFGLLIGFATLYDSYFKARSKGMTEIADARLSRFSDFSKPEEWPSGVQSSIKKKTRGSLEDVLRRLPQNVDDLSLARKAEVGATIWFMVSKEGANARQYASEAKGKVLRAGHKWFYEERLALAFLRQECGKGVEVACLDAAKLHAGNVFDLPDLITETDSDKKALAELPATGPLSNSPSVVALRKRIEEGINPYDWAHLKYRFVQLGNR